jgi:hypothetical protein
MLPTLSICKVHGHPLQPWMTGRAIIVEYHNQPSPSQLIRISGNITHGLRVAWWSEIAQRRSAAAQRVAVRWNQ